MAGDAVGVFLAQPLRKIVEQLVAELGIVGQVGLDHLVFELDLRVGEQHRQLRPRQPEARGLALGDRLLVRQELDRPVETAGLLERAHEADVPIEQPRAQRVRHRQGLGLQIVVAQDEGGDIVGDVLQQLVALLARHVAGGHDLVQQDLDVDLVVGGVDAGGVVDGVGVDAAALERVLDAGALREAEVGALADDLAAQVRGVHAQGVVGAVADVGMALLAGLHVGADAAEPEQVDLGAQQQLDQLGRRHAVLGDAEALLHLRPTA